MRTKNEILNELIEKANNEQTLSTLTFDPSSFNLALFNAIASVLYVHELYWSLFKSEIQGMLDNQKLHTLKWYENLAKSFQYGYDLAWFENRFKYENQDDESKIIKHCAVVHVGNKLRFKVATNNANGETVICSQSQIDGLSSYLQEVKDAGVYIFVTSGAGDLIKIAIDVYFDPLVLSSSGELLKDGRLIVEDTIEQWIEGINFNGRFIIPKFQDMIESIEGVSFVVVESIEVALSSQSVFTPLTNPIYKPDSGYFKLEQLDINYIADV